MPLYEYYCADCHDTFETLRPMGQADAPIQCKQCESMRTSRTLSLFAMHTKGESSSRPMNLAGNGGGCCGGGMCGCGH